MILIIDNYDSFVYNLARYVSELEYDCVVKRNDEMTLAGIQKLLPSHIILSPGPCAPQQAGISLEVVKYFGALTPILGVCLGHQAIGEAYGAVITTAKFPMHGKASMIKHNETAIFKNLPNPLTVARYHSLIVSENHFPDSLKITARCENGEIMALQHCSHPVFGVQFHPESILTEQGKALLENFIRI